MLRGVHFLQVKFECEMLVTTVVKMKVLASYFSDDGKKQVQYQR